MNGSPEITIHDSGKVTAKTPEIGSMINVYAVDRQRSVTMEVFDVYKNFLSCGYEGIEYTVRLKKVNYGGEEDSYRWEGTSD